MIEVLQPGLYTTIQDQGRKGYEEFGLPPSGAFDPFLAAVANRLVHNDLNAPLLEFALVGPTLKFHIDTWMAVAASWCQYLVRGKFVPEFSAFPVSAGDVLQFAGMKGWFGYLAFAGGIVSQPILGSCSTFITGRIGSRLKKGDILKTGEMTKKFFSIPCRYLELSSSNVIPVVPAQQTGNFSTVDRKQLEEGEYTISLQSDRMGIRLTGVSLNPPEVRRSVGALPGTIQVPRSGEPIILGPDGPTTGGYPQIAILARIAWTTLAEIRPQEKIRFEWTEIEKARQLWRYRKSIFERREPWIEVS